MPALPQGAAFQDDRLQRQHRPRQNLGRSAWATPVRGSVSRRTSACAGHVAAHARAIQVIEDLAAATVALEPMRSRLLSKLAAPASAATLATRVGSGLQKVNYHLNALEAHGLLRLAQERKGGGLTERLLVATAASYVISRGASGPVAAHACREVDRLSARYLIALGARVVSEFGDLVRRANGKGQRLATLAADAEVRIRSAADRAAFSNELTGAVTKLVSKCQGESALGGRGSAPIATEWSAEAKAGDVCVVRVVHSLFASKDDWDNQLEATEP